MPQTDFQLLPAHTAILIRVIRAEVSVVADLLQDLLLHTWYLIKYSLKATAKTTEVRRPSLKNHFGQFCDLAVKQAILRRNNSGFAIA